jgi:hypothetical protein
MVSAAKVHGFTHAMKAAQAPRILPGKSVDDPPSNAPRVTTTPHEPISHTFTERQPVPNLTRL